MRIRYCVYVKQKIPIENCGLDISLPSYATQQDPAFFVDKSMHL